MQRPDVLNLASRIEAAEALAPDAAGAAARALAAAFPAAARAGQVPEGIARSSDLLVALVLAALPGWHFSIHGRARPGGPWSCSLRRGDVLDDDEIVGAAEAANLSQALLVALLRVVAWK